MKGKAKKTKISGSKYEISSVVKAANILNSFISFDDELTVPQIAQACKITHGSAYRFMITLKSCGFIEEGKRTGIFKLGRSFLPFANKVLNQDSLLRFARPQIQALAEETNCNSSMAVLHNGKALYVARVDARGSRYTHTMFGRMAPVHCTGLGKVLISELPTREIEKIVAEEGLKKYTESTIHNLDKLLKDLDLTRKRGYATDFQELMQGVCCVAAPVRGADGKLIAAVSVSCRATEFSEKGEENLAQAVIYHAKRISSAKGNQDGYL